MNIQLSMIQTMAVALVILFLGYFLNAKVKFLKRNNIPEPVVGGIAFALLNWVVFSFFNISFTFDMTLKGPLMLAFFTTVGLGASFKLLVKGGPKVALFLLVATIYLIVQNGVGVFLAIATDLNPLSGLLAGSVTLSGGHGTGATYAEMFAGTQNLQGAFELAMACATFGLILGGLIGGPVTRRLITKYNLSPDPVETTDGEHEVNFNPDITERVTPRRMMETMLILTFCIAIGTTMYSFFKGIGIPLPSFICPLLVGIVLTNVADFSGKYKISSECVDLWGTMALSIFLALALMSLRIWELMNLAGPMLLILMVQTSVLILYTYFITFRTMGKDYNAAIIAGGHCGFGLGATPTAVANMEALVSRYGASPQAFLVVPMVGAFFIDITNTFVLQLYLALPFVN
ncbi:MAG: sodium/glutamate symporter [Bacteriovoracaceae bacterium]|nr:sodium/glutamate symporter [Bacteriovoracaceae bacterium]